MTFVVLGASGQTGSVVAEELLAAGHKVRCVVRRSEQADAWKARGAEAAVADLADAKALVRAFKGGAGLYLINPPAYHAEDIFAAAATVHTNAIQAAERAGVQHVVALSSVGAQCRRGTGNILTTRNLEDQLAESKLRTTIIRAANFMENFGWALDEAAADGVLHSMLVPVSKPIPMVSVRDIGSVAAQSLISGAVAPSLIELHGPSQYSPDDAAFLLSDLLSRPVRARAIPEDLWPDRLGAAGMSLSATKAFVEMYRGFNDGTVEFSGSGIAVRGSVTLDDALTALVADRTR